MTGAVRDADVEGNLPAAVGYIGTLETCHGDEVLSRLIGHVIVVGQHLFGTPFIKALVKEMVNEFRRPHADEGSPRTRAVTGKTLVPVNKAVFDELSRIVFRQEPDFRRPRLPVLRKGTADIKMAAIVPSGDGSSDVAAFPTADIAQGGHDLADEGMQAFGTAVRIGLYRHPILLLSQPLRLLLRRRASSGILRNSRRP